MYECVHSGTDISSGYQLEKRDIHTYQPRLDETEKASLLLEGRMWKTLDKTIACAFLVRMSGTSREAR